jgi:hypothetical protein
MFSIKKRLIILAVILMAISGVQVALAKANPGILPPNAHPHGKTLTEWGAQVFQTVFTTPLSENPFGGDTGHQCAVELIGHMALVWTNPFDPIQPYYCSLPAGSMAVVPISAYWCDSNIDGLSSEEELLQCVNDFYLPVSDVQASLDGKVLTDIDQYQVTTPATSYTLPEDNVYGLPPGTTGQFVLRGHFIIITPLSPGEHTIHIQDEYAGSLNINGTMIITVNP